MTSHWTLFLKSNRNLQAQIKSLEVIPPLSVANNILHCTPALLVDLMSNFACCCVSIQKHPNCNARHVRHKPFETVLI